MRMDGCLAEHSMMHQVGDRLIMSAGMLSLHLDTMVMLNFTVSSYICFHPTALIVFVISQCKHLVT